MVFLCSLTYKIIRYNHRAIQLYAADLHHAGDIVLFQSAKSDERSPRRRNKILSHPASLHYAVTNKPSEKAGSMEILRIIVDAVCVLQDEERRIHLRQGYGGQAGRASQQGTRCAARTAK